MEILIYSLWLVSTILLTTAICIFGNRFGVEFLIVSFVTCIVLASLIGIKIIEIGPFTVSAAIAVYSATFLISDSICEFHGKRKAKMTILATLFCLVLMVSVIQLAIHVPPAGFWAGQEAFVETFGTTWRIAVASIITFIIAQSHDVWAFHFWKKQTQGRYLWLRNNASTIASQIIDTIFFVTIAFYGIFPIIPLIIGGLVLKVILAIIDTPFLYLIRYASKNNNATS